MATKEIDLTIKIDSDKAVNNVKKLNTTLDGTKKTTTDIGGGGSKAFTTIGKAGSDAFNGIGTAIKAAGIGLLIGVVALLTEAFKKNQKIVDLVSNAINVIGQFITNLVSNIEKMITKLNQSTGGFDALKAVIINMLKMGITPLQLAFQSLGLIINEIQLAWEKSIFGGKDQNKIDELTKKIENSKNSIITLSKEYVESAKIIAKNAGEALSEVGELSKGIITAVTDAAKETSFEAAKAATDAIKQFERLEKARERIQLQGEKDAELQRQIRDNTSLTLEERIKANEKIAEILKEQEEGEKSAIAGQIAAIRTRIKVEGDNEELQNTLLELRNKQLDVESRIVGQMSEQKTNATALLEEQKTVAEESTKLKKETDDKKLEQEKAYSEELQALKDENYINSIEDENEKREAEIELEQERAEEDLQRRKDNHEISEEDFTEYSNELQKKYDIERANVIKDKNDAIVESDKNLADSRKNIATNALNSLSNLVGKETGLGKMLLMANQALAIGETVQNLTIANGKALALSPATFGQPWIGVNTAMATVGIAGMVASTAQQLGAFEDGGIIGGTSYTGDKQTIRVNSKEMVINQGQQNALWDFIKNGSMGNNNQNITQQIVDAIQMIPVVVSETDMTTMQKKIEVRENNLTF